MSATKANPLSQETDIQILGALLPNIRPVFVDVGAEKGSFAQFLVGHRFSGVLFEPLPNHKPVLDELTKNDASIRHFPYAIDQADGKAAFHIACDEAGQPLNYFHSLQKIETDPRVHHKKEIPVICRSLASLHAEGVIPQALGVLKIDTEGNDLRVLRGLGPVQADVIICEFFSRGVYNGWTEAEPAGLIDYARKLGFNQWLAVRRRGDVEMISINPIAFTEKEWGNLFFIKDKPFADSQAALASVIGASDQTLFARLEGKPKSRSRKWLNW
jgi:FkbM family methyltransferase